MQILKNKNAKWWVKTTSCLSLFVFIAVFAYFKMNFIMKGVQIVASINKNNNSSIVEIKGKAPNAIHINLNGREIFIEKDGSFNEQVALLPGLSVITIDAQDKFGKFANKKFEVIYKESEGVFAYNEMPIIN